MLLDDRHRDIARIALAAAGRKYEVAFAGGGALQIHDVSRRRTQDVDLFVRNERHVKKAATTIADALTRAGYRVEVISADEGMWDFEVYPASDSAEVDASDSAGGDPVQVQVAHFIYRGTVATDVGPAVTLDYLATLKAIAAMERHQVRDYVDIASLLDAGYQVRQLLDMAFREAPYLEPADAGDAGVHLDQVTDARLALELPPGKDPQWVRDALAQWPREPTHDLCGSSGELAR